MTEEQYRTLKRGVEEAKAAASRAKGAHDQLLKQLSDEFGCESLVEGEKLLKRLEKETSAAEQKFTKAESEYRQKWEEDDGL